MALAGALRLHAPAVVAALLSTVILRALLATAVITGETFLADACESCDILVVGVLLNDLLC